jgi:hypothetical protein
LDAERLIALLQFHDVDVPILIILLPGLFLP